MDVNEKDVPESTQGPVKNEAQKHAFDYYSD